MNNITRTSPFSSSIQTEMYWELISTKENPVQGGLLYGSDKQDQMLNEIGMVGVITGKQLKDLYVGGNRQKLRKLLQLKLLKRHTIKRGNKEVLVYTLGTTGFAITRQMGVNEWSVLKTNELLQKLVFFQFIYEMRKKGVKLQIVPLSSDDSLFTGAIHLNGRLYHVAVLRGNEHQMKSYMRYQKMPQRVILITESLVYAKNLEPEILSFYQSIRLTTDVDMEKPLDEMFYEIRQKEWTKDQQPAAKVAQ